MSGVRQETGRQRYYRQIREIKDKLDVSHSEARDLWGDYYAPGGRAIRPVVSAPIIDVTQSEAVGTMCPYCRDDLYVLDERATCGGCSATYHRECLLFELSGRCGTLGCRSRSSFADTGNVAQVARQNIVIEPIDLAASRSWAKRASRALLLITLIGILVLCICAKAGLLYKGL